MGETRKMNVPATINKMFQVVEYGYLPEPVLPTNILPSGLPFTNVSIKLVQNVAICRVGGAENYAAVFCDKYWQQIPTAEALIFYQNGPLTFAEAKLIPHELFGMSVAAWHMLEPITVIDFYERKLLQPNSMEALTWLQLPEPAFRTFGGNGIRKGYSGKRATGYVQRLYRRGAKRVIAIEVQTGQLETGLIEATDELIVELPDDPLARAELIQQWIKTFGRKSGDVPTDEGQPYLLFKWT